MLVINICISIILWLANKGLRVILCAMAYLEYIQISRTCSFNCQWRLVNDLLCISSPRCYPPTPSNTQAQITTCRLFWASHLVKSLTIIKNNVAEIFDLFSPACYNRFFATLLLTEKHYQTTTKVHTTTIRKADALHTQIIEVIYL